MTAAPKIKICVTLSEDLLKNVNRVVAATYGASRSSVIERWLRRAARVAAEDCLREQTIAYYDAWTGTERREGEKLARALSRGARKLRMD